ncbi:MAG: hypothetical protein LIP06_03145 [Tannerellaceae bacterium]|nr:hypothetical protein [Tannerellaceae bacterium]
MRQLLILLAFICVTGMSAYAQADQCMAPEISEQPVEFEIVAADLPNVGFVRCADNDQYGNPKDHARVGEPLKFYVEILNGDRASNYEYKWTINGDPNSTYGSVSWYNNDNYATYVFNTIGSFSAFVTVTEKSTGKSVNASRTCYISY